MHPDDELEELVTKAPDELVEITPEDDELLEELLELDEEEVVEFLVTIIGDKEFVIPITIFGFSLLVVILVQLFPVLSQ